MVEYIERETAIKCIESQCVDGKMWGNDESEGTLIEAYSAIDDLMDIPLVDVAPVRHGRWIVRHKGMNNWVDCSECGTVGSPHWKRCPLCEAKMDVEDNHDSDGI